MLKLDCQFVPDEYSKSREKKNLPNNIFCILDLMQRECRRGCDRSGTTTLLTFSFAVLTVGS